jgi:hypothetical protein
VGAKAACVMVQTCWQPTNWRTFLFSLLLVSLCICHSSIPAAALTADGPTVSQQQGNRRPASSRTPTAAAHAMPVTRTVAGMWADVKHLAKLVYVTGAGEPSRFEFAQIFRTFFSLKYLLSGPSRAWPTNNRYYVTMHALNLVWPLSMCSLTRQVLHRTTCPGGVQ